MFDVGGGEALVFMAVICAAVAFALYWIIRLGVRHGTLDAYRIDRVDRRIAAMEAERERGA